MLNLVSKVKLNDSPANWNTNLSPRPPFDVEKYQQELNKIAGFTQANEPVLKLVWGAEEYQYRLEGYEMVKVPRFCFLSRRDIDFGQRIPIRRWIILQNTDPGQVEAMGGKNHQKEGSLHVEEKGFYTPYIIVGDHSKCPKNCSDGRLCYGDYKAPGNAELLLITEHTFKLLQENKIDPREGIKDEDMAPFLKEMAENKEKEEQEDKENSEAFVKDWIKTHGVARVTNVKPQ